MSTPVEESTQPALRLRSVTRVDAVGPKMRTSQVDARRDVLMLGDPRLTDPFLFLSEDWFSEVGFEWHPHRGFETVTYVVDGQLEHRDNAGGQGLLGPGDLQWVTTGKGVIHAEIAHQHRPVHTLQLWLNLPAKLKKVAPRYQNLRAAELPTLREAGAIVRLYAGELRGLRGPAETIWPAAVIDGRLEAGSRFVHQVPGDHSGFVFVLKGAIAIGADRRRVAADEVAWFDAGSGGPSGIELVAESPATFIAYSGKPIREPIVQYGPFVMNHPEEINEAIFDYRRGEFGPIPD